MMKPGKTTSELPVRERPQRKREWDGKDAITTANVGAADALMNPLGYHRVEEKAPAKRGGRGKAKEQAG